MNEKPVLGSDGQAQSGSAAMQSSQAFAMITGGARRVREALSRVIVGQNEAIDLALVTLLAGGHALVEGVPGVGKTLLVKALARAVAGDFQRIQFTPDLMPADVTGTRVFDLRTQEFRLVRGPIFTNFLLADEINRAPAKTQSALLEAMQERQVTIDRETCALSPVFVVFATAARGPEGPLSRKNSHGLPGRGRRKRTGETRGRRRCTGATVSRGPTRAGFAIRRTRTTASRYSPCARQRGHQRLPRQPGSTDPAARGSLGWRWAAGNARVIVGVAGARGSRGARFCGARGRKDAGCSCTGAPHATAAGGRDGRRRDSRGDQRGAGGGRSTALDRMRNTRRATTSKQVKS
jgi:hypothetical protein